MAKACNSGNLEFLLSEIKEKLICFDKLAYAYNIGSQQEWEFVVNLGHTTRPCLKENKKERKIKNAPVLISET